jgi:hypothetical protein
MRKAVHHLFHRLDDFHVIIKARYGTVTKEIGAIEVPFNNEKGWGEKATRWHSLAA